MNVLILHICNILIRRVGFFFGKIFAVFELKATQNMLDFCLIVSLKIDIKGRQKIVLKFHGHPIALPGYSQQKISSYQMKGRRNTVMKKWIMLLALLSFIGLSFDIATGAPKDTVVIAQGVDPTTMDPHYRYDSPAFNITMNIFENLLIRSADLKIEPLLATSYRLINDTTWEFTLRNGVKF